jgi:hypothetical protein
MSKKYLVQKLHYEVNVFLFHPWPAAVVVLVRTNALLQPAQHPTELALGLMRVSTILKNRVVGKKSTDHFQASRCSYRYCATGG